MRWIFITLIFINLLLLGFFMQRQMNTVAPSAPVEVPIKGKSLVLVKEATQPLPKTTSNSAANKRANLCYAVGPFADRLDGRHLLARASALGFEGNLKELSVESDKPAEYWVYVTPRPSREQALSALRELQKRNYDSFIITQGEFSNGVSLGLFRNKESAYGLQSKVRALGYDVEVRVTNESAIEYWAEIHESSQLSESMRQRIQANETSVRWQMIECK